MYLHHFGFFERQEEVTICYSVVTTEEKKSEIGLPRAGGRGGGVISHLFIVERIT